MHAFGLSRNLCLEFLRKQCVIANLTPGKYQILFIQLRQITNLIEIRKIKKKKQLG